MTRRGPQEASIHQRVGVGRRLVSVGRALTLLEPKATRG
jgi:hypothetical protein